MARTIAKDHDQKRLHILKTAASVFANEGFARASMAQIAQACNISKATIYHYYDRKDALLFDILDTYLCQLRDLLCNLPSDGQTPHQQLRQFATETLLAYEGMDAEHQIQTEGIALLPVAEQAILRGYQRDMVARLSQIIAQVSEETFKDHPQRLKHTTMSVFGMLNWFYMWNKYADSEARKSYAAVVADLTISGVRGLR